MNKYIFMLIMIPIIVFVFYYWYLAWFHPRILGMYSEKHRRQMINLYPKFMKEIIIFVTGNPFSNVNKWEARFICTVILIILLVGFSAIFWSPAFI